MLNTVRQVFNILRDMKAMSQDIQELQEEVTILENTKADECELMDKADGCDFDALEDRVDKLEEA